MMKMVNIKLNITRGGDDPKIGAEEESDVQCCW